MIKRIYKENFLDVAKKIVTDYNDEFKGVEFFVNPSPNEYNSIKGNYDAVRGYIISKGDLYIWDSDVFHRYGIRYLIEKGIIKGERDYLTDNVTNQGMPIIIIKGIVYRGESINIRKTGIFDTIRLYYSRCKKKNSWLDFSTKWKDRRESKIYKESDEDELRRNRSSM